MRHPAIMIAALTTACGASTDDVRERIDMAATRLASVHDIYQRTLDENEEQVSALRSIGTCASPRLYGIPVAILDTNKEKWTQIRTLQEESGTAFRECLASTQDAQAAMERIRSLSAWSAEERVDRWRERMHATLDQLNAAEPKAREAELL